MSLDEYLVLLLSDSNLPTGAFVASSALESYVQHGLIPTDSSASKAQGVLDFIRKSVNTYAALNLPFVSTAHAIVTSLQGRDGVQRVIGQLRELDALFESMVLNHVARRASTTQGVALMTLYERAFAEEGESGGEVPAMRSLVEQLRQSVRAGSTYGHLPIGFSVLTGALGLSLDRSQHLFLFLHARSLLSSAIRLNTVGPYVSHRLLLHDVRPLVVDALKASRHLKISSAAKKGSPTSVTEDEEEGPATTWPLGEILAARHDQLHSKIFNS
ncbi:hypothetical protein T439DRAFT_161395 [Meredithblackwellia eburnea MCA 4105]